MTHIHRLLVSTRNTRAHDGQTIFIHVIVRHPNPSCPPCNGIPQSTVNRVIGPILAADAHFIPLSKVAEYQLDPEAYLQGLETPLRPGSAVLLKASVLSASDGMGEADRRIDLPSFTGEAAAEGAVQQGHLFYLSHDADHNNNSSSTAAAIAKQRLY
jgi:hypothetical protein